MRHHAARWGGVSSSRRHSRSSADCSSTNTPVAPETSTTNPMTDASRPTDGTCALAKAWRTTSATCWPITDCTCATRLLSR